MRSFQPLQSLRRKFDSLGRLIGLVDDVGAQLIPLILSRTSAQIASPTADDLANTFDFFQDATTKTLYRSDGSSLTQVAFGQTVASTSDVMFRDARVRHFGGGNTLNSPLIQSWGTGAGSNSTPTVGVLSGNDELLQVSVTPSATPAANQTLGVFMFADQFANPPVAVVLPMNRAACGMQGGALSAVQATTAVDRVTLSTGSALTAGTNYLFGVQLRRA